MNALQKFRKKHPVIFSLLAVVVCLLALRAAGLVYGATIGDYFEQDARADEGISTIILDGVMVLLAFAILCATGRKAVVTRKGSGFLKGLLVPLPALCWYVIAILGMITIAFAIVTNTVPEEYLESSMEYGDPSFTLTSVAVIAGFMLVGVAEEFVCRGIVAQTLLEHFGTKRSGLWIAAVISGVIFGVTHGQNILAGVEVQSAVIQSVQASFTGIFLGAVYFRTGNVWVVAFVHGLNDVMAGTSVWLFQNTVIAGLNSASTITIEYLPFLMILPMIELCISIFLLRKSKLAEVEKNWRPELERWQRESTN